MIVWDLMKQHKLLIDRGIDLEEIKVLIENKCYLDILENPSRPDQALILLDYKAYTYVVVVKIEVDQIVIKTCYPSRKFHQLRKERL